LYRFTKGHEDEPHRITPRPLPTPGSDTFLLLPPGLDEEEELDAAAALVTDLSTRLVVNETAVAITSVESIEVQLANPCGLDSARKETELIQPGLMIGQEYILSVNSDMFRYIVTGRQAHYCGTKDN